MHELSAMCCLSEHDVLCRGGLRTLIITGDYHHTALAVARQAGMVPPDTDVVIVDTCKQAHAQSELSRAATALEWTAAQAADSASLELNISRQSSAGDLPDFLRLISTRSSDLRSLRARLANLERLPDEDSQFAGLRFVDGESNQAIEPAEAIASLAEGNAQCAVTGPAFELLLRQDLSASVEVVMQNAVVFARMQPHQKGQVMDLVTQRGLHQLTASGSRFIPVFAPAHLLTAITLPPIITKWFAACVLSCTAA